MRNIIAVVIVALFIVACASSISQQQAESIALQFIEQNVKFFTRGENASSFVDDVNVPTATSYREGDVWVVVVHVTGVVDGVEKKNDLVVKVDKKGTVVEFNGQKLSKA
jgi:hypothetical protein